MGHLVDAVPATEEKQGAGPRSRWSRTMGCVARSALVLDPAADQVWERPPQTWRSILSIIFLLTAGLLSWVGTRAGHQWRIDAGLNPDHELVTSGVYRVVRHPIYTSMLCSGRFGTTRIDHRGPRMVRGPWLVDLQPVQPLANTALSDVPQ
jgi:protein-S-isoprenylcysteine O-methyltransferase Ste14